MDASATAYSPNSRRAFSFMISGRTSSRMAIFSKSAIQRSGSREASMMSLNRMVSGSSVRSEHVQGFHSTEAFEDMVRRASSGSGSGSTRLP